LAALLSKTLGRLATNFTRDDVQRVVEWLCLKFDDFGPRLTRANRAAPTPRASPASDAPDAGWQSPEGTLLPGLVEPRLHSPRPANEAPDSFFVDATVLSGTASRK
jgi:hypothetical protein